MLSESLRVPFRADDWIGTILVGSVLTLLSWILAVVWLVVMGTVLNSVFFLGWMLVAALAPLIGVLSGLLFFLPSLVLRGYLLGVVRSGIRGESTVESFVGWGSLVRDGMRSTLISAIYLIPAAALCGLALGGGVATAVDPEGFEGVVQAIAALVILFGGFGLLIYGLVYLYVRPAARAVFASTGSVRAALDVRRVGRLSITGDYITGWLIGMGILVVGPTLLVPLLAVSLAFGVISPPVAFVGVLSTILLGIVMVFYCRVSAAYATGRGSAEGLATLYPDAIAEPAEPQPTAPQTQTQPTEASAAIQTGRTVQTVDQSIPDRTNQESTDVVSVPPVEPGEGDLSGAPVFPRVGNGSASLDADDAVPTDSNAESTDTEADSTDTEPAADEDEFVWGPTEE